MFDHLKVVSLSIGLLVVLSGLCSISFATAQEKAPAKSTAVLAVTLQSAQGSVAAGGAFRAIAVSY